MFGLILVQCLMRNGIILLKTDKIDENKDFPADFIAEGVDQTWLVLYLTIGTLVLIK
jgi:hypothetical protein